MRRILAAIVAIGMLATACGGSDGGTLTVYSGRNEELVGPLIDLFTAETGIEVAVRYGDSPELAATIREEGNRSPADVFFAQDPASLGAVASADLLDRLPDEILAMVPGRFSDRDGRWVGTSGRARVVVYDTSRRSADELPTTIDGFTDPSWSGHLAVAPTNGSFLAFVAAMILIRGEDATSTWLEAIAANDARTYPKNSVIVAAVDDGDVEVGLVNHYYLLRRRAESGAGPAANHFLAGGPGALVVPAGAGILASSNNRSEAERFVGFLLNSEAQRFFVTETFEYALVPGIPPNPALPPLESIDAPDLDLSDLAAALDRATDLVARAGLL